MISTTDQILHFVERLSSTEVSSWAGRSNIFSILVLIFYQLATEFERIFKEGLNRVTWMFVAIVAIWRGEEVPTSPGEDHARSHFPSHLHAMTVLFIIACPLTIEIAVHKWTL